MTAVSAGPGKSASQIFFYDWSDNYRRVIKVEHPGDYHESQGTRTSSFGNALSKEPATTGDCALSIESATTGDEGSGGSSSKRGRWRGGQVVVKTFVVHLICILLYT